MTGQHDSKSSGFDLSNLSTGITENDLEQVGFIVNTSVVVM